MDEGGQYIVKLRIGSRVFAPRWIPSLVTAALLPGLLNLGFWQLRRAEEKRVLMQQAAQGQASVVVLEPGKVSALSRYQRVQVAGQYDSAHQVLLDNMPSNEPTTQGQPGYRVLTPLQLASGDSVLVDRGWLPLSDRSQLPSVAVDASLRVVTGLLDELPQPGVRAGDAGIRPGQWPQLLNYPKWSELQQLYGTPLLSRIVLLEAGEPDGFGRSWQITQGFSPERHVGYAVQWFGLAATLLIIYVVVNLKRAGSE